MVLKVDFKEKRSWLNNIIIVRCGDCYNGVMVFFWWWGFIIKIIGSRDLSVDYVIISGYVSLENFKVFE